MITVYALYSKKYNKIYVGFSDNTERRLREHNHIANDGYTKKYQPWEIIYEEKINGDYKDARKREKQLKSSRGRNFIWNIVSRTNGEKNIK